MSQNMSQNNELMKFYIKHINTDQSVICFYPSSITVSQFIYEIQGIGADIIHVNYTMVEVVEAGQEIPGVKSENAPKMEEENISMYQKYGDKLKYMAFYIRKKTN